MAQGGALVSQKRDQGLSSVTVSDYCQKTGLTDFPGKRALNKVKHLLTVCQILRNFTEGNSRKFTLSFAFCAHVDVIKY